ncbi:chemotaxis-specific protein-glutamate methyltransferase CheB [Aerosakkonemataceae cyanobacterium BLCC-F154]|uniref:Protein-glutamate methylesterase/protein-glutamine glutaminase n=1 Tax=Floridaenema fluviatile BLCC-F154 TaxID=3153640 RepID=A0ABV4YIN7_9CYAN
MPIRVLLVEDSPVALVILKRILATSSDIEVVGTARHGREALDLIPKLQPQVICTDYHMPQMNGLEFTEEVMIRFPRPILVISASVQAEDTQTIFKMLNAGAVDVFPKPRSPSIEEYELLKQELISKIKILSGVTVFTRHRRSNVTTSFDRPPLKLESKTNIPISRPSGISLLSRNHDSKPKIVAIGASTGGPQAINNILSQLPINFPLPILCVQHISEGFLQGLVDWLGSESQLPVRIAQFGEIPQPGIVYFPPEGRHLELDNFGKFVCSSSPPVSGHRPSVTVTFASVAKCYSAASIAVLLTGMGRDGADGMLAIAKAGGITIAQNEASCVVFGMPKEAIALGAAKHILPVNQIATMLLKQLNIVAGSNKY